MDNIILIGMPGSGKSTVGVLLAKTLGYGFIDTDLTIQQREGALLQEILDKRGLEAFLDAEEAAICSVTCTGTVIAPGGSAVCREGAIGHLKQLGTVVYLRVSLEELKGALRRRMGAYVETDMDAEEAAALTIDKVVDLLAGGMTDGFTAEAIQACTAKIRTHTRA